LQTYQDINNGVYRSGFATTQRAYDQAQYGLYSMLDEIEERLGGSRFLLGDR
jgi:putative glutathione S-transferase